MVKSRFLEGYLELGGIPPDSWRSRSETFKSGVISDKINYTSRNIVFSTECTMSFWQNIQKRIIVIHLLRKSLYKIQARAEYTTLEYWSFNVRECFGRHILLMASGSNFVQTDDIWQNVKLWSKKPPIINLWCKYIFLNF